MDVDYSTNTVVQLKEIFKSRGEPTTGLTRKQQLIDRLTELDAEAAQKEEHTAKEATDNQEGGDVADANADEEGGIEQTTAPEEAVAEDHAMPDAAEALQEKITPQPSSTPTAAEVEPQTSIDVPQVPNASETEAEGGKDTADNEKTVPEDAPLPDAPDANPSPPPGTEVSVTDDQAQAPQSEEPPSNSPSTASAIGPEDSRKRKRRSATPPVREEDVALKRAKPNDDTPEVHLKEDVSETAAPVVDAPQDTTAQETDDPAETTSHEAKKPFIAAKYQERIKGLQRNTALQADGAYANLTDVESRDVIPSVHPATNALYISELVRPLKEESFKVSLLNHAEPLPSAEDDAEEGSKPETKDVEAVKISTFYLDRIRSHCFAVLSSVTAASRVRTSLHGQVFPRDGDRKPLWIDFVPPEKVQEWIKREQDEAARSGSSMLRWEIVYERLDDGQVSASLQEAAPVQPYAQPRDSFPQVAQRSVPQAPARPIVPPAQQTAFTTLDQTFRSTKNTKPMLYFLPVDDETVDARLDELDQDLSTRYPDSRPRGPPPILKKYVLEDDDRIYFDGPDRVDPPTGPRGGGGGGYGGGGPRGRGGRRGWGGRY